jgi:hypothetical protein
MSGDDIDDLADLLGPEPDPEETEVLVDEAPTPKSRPMGEASRGLLKRSRSYPVNRVAKKNTPDRLKRLLSYIAEMPVTSDACTRANISVSTLKYWLQKSKEGKPGDGFDINLGEDDETEDEGNTIRFHLAWDDFMEVGVGLVERSVFQRGTGYEEVLTYQGKVQYKLDPEKVEIALMVDDTIDDRNPALWLRDKFGAPVPETVWKMDPDLAMFLLKTRKPQMYGAKSQIDLNVKGGVLVVGMKLDKPEDLNLIEEQYRREGLPPVIFEESDGEDE